MAKTNQHDLENQNGVRGKRSTTDGQVVIHEQWIELKQLLDETVRELYAAIGTAGTDANAIHDNTANEIFAITEKTTPASTDILIIEDSAAAYIKKKLQITNLPSGSHTLDGGQTDVTITTPGDNEVLAYDTGGGGIWINQTASEAGLLADSADIIKNTHIDWGSGAGQVDADDIPESATLKWASESGADVTANNTCNTPGGAGTDTTAIHDNVANEITGITNKSSLDTADEFLLEDSAAGYVKKAVTLDDLQKSISWGGIDSTAIHDNQANELTAITNKASVVAADELLIEDSAAAYVKKAVLFSVLEGSLDHNNLTNTHNLTTDIDHDQLTNFSADEHLDWTLDQGAKNIHNNNVQDGADATAIHDDTANEITGIINKASCSAADEFLIEDSDAVYVKKAVLFSALEGSIDHTNITNIGTNSHATIDTHIAATSNPHSTDIGNLGSGTIGELNTALTDATLYEWENDLGGTQVHTNNIPDGADATAIHDNTANEITGITNKSTLVDADEFLIEDSAATYAKKAVLFSVIKTAILSAAYPVGSIYFSISATNPGTSLGFGTWVAWGAGKMPIGVDSGNTKIDAPEESGGSFDHTHSVTSNVTVGNHNTQELLYTPGETLEDVVTDLDVAHSVTNNAVTSGGNNPPFIAVYMWKRTV